MLVYSCRLPRWLSGKEPAYQCRRHRRLKFNTQVQDSGSGIPSGGGNATHSSILAWKTPWTEEPGGLQSTRSQRVRHNWATGHTGSVFIMAFLKLFVITVPKPRMIWSHSTVVESQVAGIQVEQKVQVREIFQYPSKDRCWEGVTICLSSYNSHLSISLMLRCTGQGVFFFNNLVQTLLETYHSRWSI